MEQPKKQYRKVIIQFEKITSNDKTIFIHYGPSILIAVSKAYLKKVLENQQQSNQERAS